MSEECKSAEATACAAVAQAEDKARHAAAKRSMADTSSTGAEPSSAVPPMSAPSPRAALRTRTLSARGGCIGHRAPSCGTASLVLHLDRGGANRGLRRLALLRHRSSQRQKTTRGSTWHRTSQQITAAPSETSAKPPGTSAEGTTRKQATINQSVSHLEPVSLTLLRCVLRSRAATAELIHQGGL